MMRHLLNNSFKGPDVVGKVSVRFLWVALDAFLEQPHMGTAETAGPSCPSLPDVFGQCTIYIRILPMLKASKPGKARANTPVDERCSLHRFWTRG